MQNSFDYTDYSRVSSIADFKSRLREQYMKNEITDEETISPDELAEIAEIAHACRADYLRLLEENEPDEYIQGCVGANKHINELIELERKYENTVQTIQ